MRALLCTVLALAALPAAAADGLLPEASCFVARRCDLAAVARAAQAQGQPALVLFFEMEDCPACRQMHEEVLSRGEVRERFGRQLASYRIDMLGRRRLLDFAGRDVSEAGFAKAQRVVGTPTVIAFDLSGRELWRLPGVPRDTAEFMALGAQALAAKP